MLSINNLTAFPCISQVVSAHVHWKFSSICRKLFSVLKLFLDSIVKPLKFDVKVCKIKNNYILCFPTSVQAKQCVG